MTDDNGLFATNNSASNIFTLIFLSPLHIVRLCHTGHKLEWGHKDFEVAMATTTHFSAKTPKIRLFEYSPSHWPAQEIYEFHNCYGNNARIFSLISTINYL